MALADLITAGYSGQPLTDEARQALRESLFNAQKAEIERTYGNQARDYAERTFGRGLGLSSVMAQYLAENERLRGETLAKAQANAEQAARQAQMAALGGAAAWETGRLNREQAAHQFGQTQSQARSSQRQQLVGQGLAGLTGAGLQTTGLIFGPNIRDWARNRFGATAPTPRPPESGAYLSPGGGPPGAAGLPEEQMPTAPMISGLEELGGAPASVAPDVLPDFTPPAWSGDFGALPQATVPDWTSGITSLADLVQPQNWWDWNDQSNWGL